MQIDSRQNQGRYSRTQTSKCVMVIFNTVFCDFDKLTFNIFFKSRDNIEKRIKAFAENDTQPQQQMEDWERAFQLK